MTGCRQVPLTAPLQAMPSLHTSPGLLIPLTLQQHRGDATSGDTGLSWLPSGCITGTAGACLDLGSAQSPLLWASTDGDRGWLERDRGWLEHD